MKQFLSVGDVKDVGELVARALYLKNNPTALSKDGKGRTLINLFFNPSLRTRISTEKAGKKLLMDVITMDAGGGWKIEFEDGRVMNGDTAEHIREAAGVLSQYADVLAVRSFPGLEDRQADYEDRVMESFRRFASVPLMSLESATRHPLQSLADAITIQENSPRPKPKVVLTWAPHPRRLPQAVANSFSEWMLAWGEVEFVIANPEGMNLAPEFTRGATILHDQDQALEGADFVYAKNWSSYQDYGKIHEAPNWQITAQKMGLTQQAKFMHCLPVRRNVVVADEVLDGANSLVLQQANNRTWAAAIVLQHLLGYFEK